MKNMSDISAAARREVETWFTKQCRESFSDFFWWYQETTPSHNGGFLIAKDRPANADYAIAGKLQKHLTKDQNLALFLDVARRLPILEY